VIAPASAPRRSLSLAAYRLAAGLAAPLARPLLEARARQGKEDEARLGERLGHPSVARPSGPLVWLHAVSVGESVSLLPLIVALDAERPDLALLVTSGTRASAKVLAERLPARAIHQYAPVDTPGAVDRFLAHWRPDVGLFAESELWPNLILAARGRGVRLALVSARMTERSARAWSARPSAAKAMLASFEVILPQDEASARRLVGLGGHLSGRLNLKRLAAPLGHDVADLARLRAEIGERPVIVAVSTHPQEERMIADAAACVADRPLLVLLPRHPERGAELAQAFADRSAALRSRREPITGATGVYIADTLGEVGLFLRLAPFAIVGGGFAAGVGGHNPLEPAQLGVGVISGPHAPNHAEVYDEMEAAGAALIAQDQAQLFAVLTELMANQARRETLAAAARAYAEAQAGQLGAALAQIRPLLPPALAAP